MNPNYEELPVKLPTRGHKVIEIKDSSPTQPLPPRQYVEIIMVRQLIVLAYQISKLEMPRKSVRVLINV